ncbi:MAG: amidohydrolase family protein [Clostridia bacterium]
MSDSAISAIPIVDTHTHPLLHPRQQMVEFEHTAEHYRSRAQPAGIVRAAALVMAPEGDLALTQTLNDAAIELARHSAGFFFPVCSVHPRDGEPALEELERVKAAGARFIKLHPNTQQFDVADAAVATVVEKAAALDLPVLFDAYAPWDANQPGKFIQLAMKVPQAHLILAHAHGPRFPELAVYDVLARYSWWQRRVYIDISAMGSLFARSPFADQFVWVLRKVGADRVLFGSDYPLHDPAEAVANVRALGFTEEEQRLIFHDNALRLLGEG